MIQVLHSVVIFLADKPFRNTVKSDGGGETVVAFTITEMNYLMVSLFFDVDFPFRIYMCDIVLLAALFVLFPA